jgi:hypothetical protein
MIFSTRIRETDQVFAHVENKSADMVSAMTFKPGVSGNPLGNRHHSRHLLNQEFIQALLLHFRQHGKKAIDSSTGAEFPVRSQRRNASPAHQTL